MSTRRTAAMTAVGALVLAGLTAGTLAGAGESDGGDVAAATVPAETAEVFVGVTPFRLLDTRIPVGVPTATPLGPGQSLTLQVAGANGIPAIATSAAINVTVDNDATAQSYITVWPAGTNRPLTSANNPQPGLIMPNLTMARLGSGGAIGVYNDRGHASVIIDVVGYYVPVSQVSGLGGTNLLTGSSGPDGGLGDLGDVYINVTNGDFYGPKTPSGWGSPVALGSVGPQGPTGPQGPAGATGATGAQGPAGGLLAGLHASNSNLVPIGLGIGAPVDFEDLGYGFGTGISAADANTFTLAPGTYEVSYRVSTAALSLLGGLELRLDGVAVSPNATLVTAGLPLTDTVLFNAPTGGSLELVDTGLALTLAAGSSASITIERVA